MKDIFKKIASISFTKICITCILTVLVCLLLFTYIMIAMALFKGYDSMIIQSMCSLSGTLVTGIGGTVIGYLCKSYFETREEESVKLYRDEYGLNDKTDVKVNIEREWEDGR